MARTFDRRRRRPGRNGALGQRTDLRLIHDDFDGETKTYHEVEFGWSEILSGLKTLLEIAEPLHIGEEAEMPA